MIVSNDRAQKLIDLVEFLPDSDKHIFFDDVDSVWTATNEFLCGSFAGRSFSANTKLDAVKILIAYFDEHIGHESIVGKCVTKSGWPDLRSVRKFCTEV